MIHGYITFTSAMISALDILDELGREKKGSPASGYAALTAATSLVSDSLASPNSMIVLGS